MPQTFTAIRVFEYSPTLERFYRPKPLTTKDLGRFEYALEAVATNSFGRGLAAHLAGAAAGQLHVVLHPDAGRSSLFGKYCYPKCSFLLCLCHPTPPFDQGVGSLRVSMLTL